MGKTWALGFLGALVILVSQMSRPMPVLAEDYIVGLITRTDIDPFSVAIRNGAETKAKELGVELRSYGGKHDGDNESQVAAIESLIAAGAKGILITPVDPKAILPSVEKARQGGVLIIALSTPLDPAGAADSTLATDSSEAGRLVGAWAAAQLRVMGQDPHLLLLDRTSTPGSADFEKMDGFLNGFEQIMTAQVSCNCKCAQQSCRERCKQCSQAIAGAGTAIGLEGGRTATTDALTKDASINVVFAADAAAAEGAYETLRSFGKEDSALIVSADGGCPAIENVKKGIIDATWLQFPEKMGAFGVEAVQKWVNSGVKPTSTEGKDFVDTGVALVTDKPVDGVPSIGAEEALRMCWG
jgi:fructose transport system substrate-binding protein